MSLAANACNNAFVSLYSSAILALQRLASSRLLWRTVAASLRRSSQAAAYSLANPAKAASAAEAARRLAAGGSLLSVLIMQCRGSGVMA